MTRSLHSLFLSLSSNFHFPASRRCLRLCMRTSGLLALLILLPLALAACPRSLTPTATLPVASPTSPPKTTPSPSLPSPTPMPFLPPLQYFLSPRSQLVHVQAVDTDDDGIEETIILYRDSDRPDGFIRGLVAEPPTSETPTHTPSADTVPLPDVYWLGHGAAVELFQDNWEKLRVEDINGDGRTELLLEGHWDAETPAVHVFQWDGEGYVRLLGLQARGELTIEEDVGEQLRFATLEHVFPRSGIITRGSALWEDGRYQVLYETTWETEAPADAPHPEAALVHYYQALAAVDANTAYRWLSGDLQAQLDAAALGDRLMWLPDLRLERLELLEETTDAARVTVALRWTDPFTGEVARSEDEVWEIVRQADGWRLARLNGTPSEPEWRSSSPTTAPTTGTDDGLTEDLVSDLILDTEGRLWIACGNSGITLSDGTYWIAIQEQEDGLANDTVHALLLDPLERFWFATPAGITRYDGIRWLTYTTADGLPSDEVNALAADAQGTVWAGTRLGAARFDGEAWQPLPLPENVRSTEVNAIAVDEDGAVWLGFTTPPPTGEGALVARYDGEGWQFFGPQDGLVGDSVSALSVAPDGSLWAAMADSSGTGGGLGVWTGEEWRVQTVFDALVDVPVYDIAFDAIGGMWIGTARGAAYGFGSAWLSYATAGRPTADAVNVVLVAPDGLVYFGTAAGLTSFRDAVPLQVIGGGQ